MAGTARPSGLHLATPSAGRAELTEQVQSEAGASGRGSHQRVPCEPHAMMWHLNGGHLSLVGTSWFNILSQLVINIP